VLATVISAGFACLSWYFIEKPALGWNPRRKRESTEIHPQNIDLQLTAPHASS
jgi:peptidoglycan/LPS O-acetylase OafA/YrhL